MVERRGPGLAFPTVIESIEQSQTDIAAGRVDDFDHYLTRLRIQIEDRATALAQKRSGSTADP